MIIIHMDLGLGDALIYNYCNEELDNDAYLTKEMSNKNEGF